MIYSERLLVVSKLLGDAEPSNNCDGPCHLPEVNRGGLSRKKPKRKGVLLVDQAPASGAVSLSGKTVGAPILKQPQVGEFLAWAVNGGKSTFGEDHVIKQATEEIIGCSVNCSHEVSHSEKS
jgi:hypothetical protein